MAGSERERGGPPEWFGPREGERRGPSACPGRVERGRPPQEDKSPGEGPGHRVREGVPQRVRGDAMSDGVRGITSTVPKTSG